MNDRAKVLFFATLREKAGTREDSIEFPTGSSIADIRNLLVEKYPGLKTSMDTVVIAMNHEFAFDEYIVHDGSEIALFPPVSGGGEKAFEHPNVIALVDDDIDINTIVERITLKSTGAVSVFTGVVREVTSRGEIHQTRELEYEAYQEMAEAKMHQICEEIRDRWRDIEGIAIIQRTGKLSPGKISVVVACSSSHRDCGIFEASRYGIDRLKEIVPIWKKEVSNDGEEWVEGDYQPQRGE